MRLEFPDFFTKQTITFTMYGLEIVPNQIAKPSRPESAFSSDFYPHSYSSSPIFHFYSYRSFAHFIIYEPLESVYCFAFYFPQDPYSQAYSSLTVSVKCSSQDLEILKNLIMENMN